MSAPRPKVHLELVRQAEEPEPDPDWTAQRQTSAWEPEHQLLGALLHLPAEKARQVLAGVPAEAIQGHHARWAFELITTLVRAGKDPGPVAVLAAGHRQASTQALSPASPPRPSAYRKLAVYLAAAYTDCVNPAAVADYVREALDLDYRRVLAEEAVRMQQLAECAADLGDLAAEVAASNHRIAVSLQAAQTAAKSGR